MRFAVAFTALSTLVFTAALAVPLDLNTRDVQGVYARDDRSSLILRDVIQDLHTRNLELYELEKRGRQGPGESEASKPKSKMSKFADKFKSGSKDNASGSGGSTSGPLRQGTGMAGPIPKGLAGPLPKGLNKGPIGQGVSNVKPRDIPRGHHHHPFLDDHGTQTAGFRLCGRPWSTPNRSPAYRFETSCHYANFATLIAFAFASATALAVPVAIATRDVDVPSVYARDDFSSLTVRDVIQHLHARELDSELTELEKRGICDFSKKKPAAPEGHALHRAAPLGQV
ncbi:hypothetical protein EIP91_009771 [Steccherinum ochraceum]|uniref:Uncharacterized protein n=1 Tax=Steccherinum ochraceum TaxID=92696 RepID=A0A4R0R6M8_9APHY|nr:hypothetical protein EIP91_009771 [Steccherinum ochraceum]